MVSVPLGAGTHWACRRLLVAPRGLNPPRATRVLGALVFSPLLLLLLSVTDFGLPRTWRNAHRLLLKGLLETEFYSSAPSGIEKLVVSLSKPHAESDLRQAPSHRL